jgi:hypothetical protein
MYAGEYKAQREGEAHDTRGGYCSAARHKIEGLSRGHGPGSSLLAGTGVQCRAACAAYRFNSLSQSLGLRKSL